MLHIFIFSGAYTLDVVDVIIAAITDALRMQVNILQTVNGKVAVTLIFQSYVEF